MSATLRVAVQHQEQQLDCRPQHGRRLGPARRQELDVVVVVLLEGKVVLERLVEQALDILAHHGVHGDLVRLQAGSLGRRLHGHVLGGNDLEAHRVGLDAVVLEDPLQVGKGGIFLPDAMFLRELLGEPRPLGVELEGRAVPVAARALQGAVQQDVVDMAGIHLEVPAGDIAVCVFLLCQHADPNGLLGLEWTGKVDQVVVGVGIVANASAVAHDELRLGLPVDRESVTWGLVLMLVQIAVVGSYLDGRHGTRVMDAARDQWRRRVDAGTAPRRASAPTDACARRLTPMDRSDASYPSSSYYQPVHPGLGSQQDVPGGGAVRGHQLRPDHRAAGILSLPAESRGMHQLLQKTGRRLLAERVAPHRQPLQLGYHHRRARLEHLVVPVHLKVQYVFDGRNLAACDEQRFPRHDSAGRPDRARARRPALDERADGILPRTLIHGRVVTYGIQKRRPDHPRHLDLDSRYPKVLQLEGLASVRRGGSGQGRGLGDDRPRLFHRKRVATTVIDHHDPALRALRSVIPVDVHRGTVPVAIEQQPLQAEARLEDPGPVRQQSPRELQVGRTGSRRQHALDAHLHAGFQRQEPDPGLLAIHLGDVRLATRDVFPLHGVVGIVPHVAPADRVRPGRVKAVRHGGLSEDRDASWAAVSRCIRGFLLRNGPARGSTTGRPVCGRPLRGLYVATTESEGVILVRIGTRPPAPDGRARRALSPFVCAETYFQTGKTAGAKSCLKHPNPCRLLRIRS